MNARPVCHGRNIDWICFEVGVPDLCPDMLYENGKGRHGSRVQRSVGKVRLLGGEHQRKELWVCLREFHIGKVGCDTVWEFLGRPSRFCRGKRLTEQLETERGQRRQQAPGIAEVMGKGSVANTRSPGHPAQRQGLDTAFLKFESRLFEQFRPQVSMMIGLLHWDILQLHLSGVKI